MAETFSTVIGTRLRFILSVYSLGLYSTIKTLREGADYRLLPVFSRIRDFFESGEIDLMQWVEGCNNLTDGITKPNSKTQKEISTVISNVSIKNDVFEEVKRVTST